MAMLIADPCIADELLELRREAQAWTSTTKYGKECTLCTHCRMTSIKMLLVGYSMF